VKTQQKRELLGLIDSETEALVIGTILRDGEPAFRQVEFLEVEDFGVEIHQVVFHAIKVLAAEVHPTVDVVADHLIQAGKLDSVGGLTGLVDLDEKGLSGAPIAGFGKALRRKSIDRRAQRLNSKLTEALELGFSVNSSAVRNVADELRALEAELETSTLPRSFGDLLTEAGGVDGLLEPPKDLVEFAWPSNLCPGFQPGQLVVFAGATSMGKTALGLQQALHTAGRGQRTLLVSLEMSSRENLLRCLSAAARVRHQDLQNGDLSEAQRTVVREAAARLSRLPLEITTETRSLESIWKKIAGARRRGSAYGLVVIDYLQLIATRNRHENRTAQVSEISRGLKLMARENSVPIIALAQLNRAPATRTGDHEPQLSDLRDSGSIEQDADLVIFVHRPGYYNLDHAGPKNAAKLIVRKQRNGPTGSQDLVFVPQFVVFARAATEDLEPPVKRSGE
jgi:replicative DNA helicase